MDPFAGSFDDIYKQAGAENLVKKPIGGMARQQQQKPKPSPSPPPPAPAPAPAFPSRPQAGVPALNEKDLEDFLGPGSKPNSTGPAPQQQHKQQQPAADDPFAVFGDVDGAMPVMQDAPAAPPPSTFDDSDDLLGLGGGGGTAKQQPRPPPTSTPSTATAATAVESPRSPAYHPPSAAFGIASPLPAAPPSPPASVGSADDEFQPPPSYNEAAGGYRGYAGEQEPVGHGLDQPTHPSEPWSPTSSADGASHFGYVRQHSHEYEHTSSRTSPRGARSPPPHTHPVQQPQLARASFGSDADYPPPPPPQQQQQEAGHAHGGMSGMLRSFGKRAIKSAQAGLHQLEAALEERRQQQQQQQQQQGGADAQPPRSSSASQHHFPQPPHPHAHTHTFPHLHARTHHRAPPPPPPPTASPLSAHRPAFKGNVMPIPDRDSPRQHGAFGGTPTQHAAPQAAGARTAGTARAPAAHASAAASAPQQPHAQAQGQQHTSVASAAQAAKERQQRKREEARSIAMTIQALPVDEQDHVLSNLSYQLQVEVVRIMEETGSSRAAHPGAAAHMAADIQTSSFDIDALAAQAEAESAAQSRQPPSSTSSSRAGTAPQHPLPTQPSPLVTESSADLLGLGGDAGSGVSAAPVSSGPPQRHMPPPPQQQRPPQYAQQRPAPPPPPPVQQPSVASVEEVDDFFSGGASAAPTQPTTRAPTAAPTRAAAPNAATAGLYAPAPRPAAQQQRQQYQAGVDKEPAVDWAKLEAEDRARELRQAQQAQRPQQAEESGDEPEERRQLRAARLAERQSKMEAALAEKQAKDEEEARKQAEQVELKERLKARIDSWRSNKKGNIRAMLSSLEHVLWEGSGWNPVSMADLLEPAQVKKVYMKANLLVHPDKVRQRNGTPEQIAIADMTFDVLKEAWIGFQK